MQYTDESCQTEEIWVRLDEHALDLVEFGTGHAWLLRGFVEARDHGGVNLELQVRHGLECHRQRQYWSRRVHLDILRAQLPEIIWEDDGLVEAFQTSFVSLGLELDVYETIRTCDDNIRREDTNRLPWARVPDWWLSQLPPK